MALPSKKQAKLAIPTALIVLIAAACLIARACVAEQLTAAEEHATAFASQAMSAIVTKNAWPNPVRKFARAVADNMAIAAAAVAAVPSNAILVPINA